MTIYNSHIKNLRIVLGSSKPIFEGGIRVGSTTGKYAQFNDGQFQTDDKKVIQKLEGLPTFKVDFWRASDEPEKSQEEENKNQGPDFESMTKQELTQLAQDKGLEVDPKLNKKELVELLNK